MPVVPLSAASDRIEDLRARAEVRQGFNVHEGIVANLGLDRV